MAGDWIKMRPSLLTSPKVNGIARYLESCVETAQALSTGCNEPLREIVTRSVMRHVTVSALLIVWGAANEHTEDGIFRNADLSDIDDMVGIPGFGAALESVGWAEFDAEDFSVTLPNFNEYNTCGKERSATAKTGAERQKEYRDRKKSDKTVTKSDVTECNGSDVTSDRREEKRREEKSKPALKTSGVNSTSVGTLAGSVCARLRQAGIASVNPSHPKLLALLDAGLTEDEIVAAADGAAAAGKGFAWVLAKAEGIRREAAKVGNLPPARASPGCKTLTETRTATIAGLTGKTDKPKGQQHEAIESTAVRVAG